MTRFRYASDPLCLASCALYVANCWAWKPHTDSEFLRAHFNDLLLIPCALPLILWLHRRLGWRTHDRLPEFGEIALHLGVWTLMAEAVAPPLFGVTGDPLDVLAYTVGAVITMGWWRLRVLPPTSARADAPQGWWRQSLPLGSLVGNRLRSSSRSTCPT